MWLSRDLIQYVIFILCCAAAVHAIPNYGDLPPGPYCAGRFDAGQCCPGRIDGCSRPILGTLCYCDEFCNRTREEDCCPDYWSHCRGIELPTESPIPEPLRRCYFKGNYYYHDQKFKMNCNTCKCSSLGRRAEVLCEENRCLIDYDLLDELGLESENLGWRAGNQTDFWGRTLDDGIQLRLGTLNPAKSIHNMNPVKRIYNPDLLPREFDARTRWPRDIAGIHDQGWCGASWAISTADVASDRFALMSEGVEAVQLSAQRLISCNIRNQQGCHGGHLDRAWHFMRKFGSVDEDCYPWVGKDTKCKMPRRTNLRNAGCRPPENPLRKDLYKVGPAYRLGNETDIMKEILTSGPVQATMRVYQDFFVYKSGIYRHSRAAERHRSGYHSVRILGWGEELSGNYPPVKYWIVANSWGTSWGENGLFRIVKGTNECEIETYVLGIWANTLNL